MAATFTEHLPCTRDRAHIPCTNSSDLITNLRGGYSHTLFTDEDTEAQSGEVP